MRLPARSVLIAVLLLGQSPGYGADLFGVPWNADGLANLEIGKEPGRLISVRFRAASSQLQTVRFFLIFRALGYYAGDGGQVRVDLEPDDGSGSPNGTSLVHFVIADPMAGSSFPQWNTSATLTSGARYHLVFSNPAPDPVHHYVSLDDLSLSRGESAPLQPAVPDADWAITWKESGTSAWSLKTDHSPIAEFDYADGTVQGCAYVDAHTSAPVSIGAQGIAETFTPSTDIAVGAVSMRFKGTGIATVTLVPLDGSTGWSGSVSAPADYAFVPATLPAPFTLRHGVTYRLQLQGAGSVYRYQKGGRYGFRAFFREGRAQEWNGTAWVDAGGADYADWPFYLVPAPTGTGTQAPVDARP